MGNEADFDDFVLLGQAGIPEQDVREQVNTLIRSPAFEGSDRPKQLLEYLVEKALLGKVPRVAEIARDVFGKEEIFADDSLVRNTLRKLRRCLQEHYAKHAESGEIRLHVRAREHMVFAPRAAFKNSSLSRRPTQNSASRDFIEEPENDAEVHFRTIVRCRIEALSLDLRPWLVIKIPVGLFYPQCRVSRDAPEEGHEVRVGLAGWGTNEDAVYEINLVSAGSDGDTEFYQYLKSGRDGFGFVLPSDCRVLDTKKVIRRDIRPKP